MDRRHFVATLAGAALPLAAVRLVFGQEQKPGARTWSALQKLLADYVGAKKLAGAAVAVADGGAPLTYLKLGRIALDADAADAAFDEHSVCRIYSMTKPVTGLAAMLLVETGKLRLDQPVADVIPELRTPQVAIDPSKGLEARPAAQTMTIRHLLTHTAGLVYWTPLQDTDALSAAYRTRGITPGNYGAGLTRPGYGPQAAGLDDMVKRLAEVPLAAEPGTVWRYSIGLDVMGLVIQRVSGKPLDVFAREQLFEPLRMAATGFQVPAAALSRLTTNYTVTANGLVPLDPRETSVFLKPPALLAGGAGLVSTARDFARIGAMLIGDGELEGVRVMRAETARLARSNLLPPAVRYAGGGYGAGMRVAAGGRTPHDEAGAVSWNGAAGTMWLVDPARRFNFVFMSQFMPPTSYPIWTEVDAALEVDRASR
jgi:CubicO group peptidase (beta-lactamase class C family)